MEIIAPLKRFSSFVGCFAHYLHEKKKLYGHAFNKEYEKCHGYIGDEINYCYQNEKKTGKLEISIFLSYIINWTAIFIAVRGQNKKASDQKEEA